MLHRDRVTEGHGQWQPETEFPDQSGVHTMSASTLSSSSEVHFTSKIFKKVDAFNLLRTTKGFLVLDA